MVRILNRVPAPPDNLDLSRVFLPARVFDEAGFIPHQRDYIVRDAAAFSDPAALERFEPGRLASTLAGFLPQLPALLSPENSGLWRGARVSTDFQSQDVLSYRIQSGLKLRVHRFNEETEGGGAHVHNHPWSFATCILKNSYLMGVGEFNSERNDYVLSSLHRVNEGSSYEMHPGTAHFIFPRAAPVITVALSCEQSPVADPATEFYRTSERANSASMSLMSASARREMLSDMAVELPDLIDAWLQKNSSTAL